MILTLHRQFVQHDHAQLALKLAWWNNITSFEPVTSSQYKPMIVDTIQETWNTTDQGSCHVVHHTHGAALLPPPKKKWTAILLSEQSRALIPVLHPPDHQFEMLHWPSQLYTLALFASKVVTKIYNLQLQSIIVLTFIRCQQYLQLTKTEPANHENLLPLINGREHWWPRNQFPDSANMQNAVQQLPSSLCPCLKISKAPKNKEDIIHAITQSLYQNSADHSWRNTKDVTTALPNTILASFPVLAFVCIHCCLAGNTVSNFLEPAGFKGIILLLRNFPDCSLFHLQTFLLRICLHAAVNS